MSQSQKAYYVERVGHTVTSVLIHAATAREAAELVASGCGEEVDSRTEFRGMRRPRRAPREDKRS